MNKYAGEIAARLKARRGDAKHLRLTEEPQRCTVGCRLRPGYRQRIEEICELHGVVLSDWLRHEVELWEKVEP